jgi:hypothetical protein
VTSNKLSMLNCKSLTRFLAPRFRDPLETELIEALDDLIFLIIQEIEKAIDIKLGEPDPDFDHYYWIYS